MSIISSHNTLQGRHEHRLHTQHIAGEAWASSPHTTHCRGGMGIVSTHNTLQGRHGHRLLTQHIAREAWASSPHTTHCRGGMGIVSTHNTLQGRHGHRLHTQHIAGEAWASSPHTNSCSSQQTAGEIKMPQILSQNPSVQRWLVLWKKGWLIFDSAQRPRISIPNQQTGKSVSA